MKTNPTTEVDRPALETVFECGSKPIAGGELKASISSIISTSLK
jgi:hypothetical protein